MQSRIVARNAITAGPQPGLKEWNGQLLDPAQEDGIGAAPAADHVTHGLAQSGHLVAPRAALLIDQPEGALERHTSGFREVAIAEAGFPLEVGQGNAAFHRVT